MASVRERERLLEEGPGLIDPLGFLLATYKGDRPGRRLYRAGLSVCTIYWRCSGHIATTGGRLPAPGTLHHGEGLQGGFRYGDAQTDDARLVLRDPGGWRPRAAKR